MKTFSDLIFTPHRVSEGAEKLPSPLNEQYGNAKQAVMNFENGYAVSVIIGGCFYSNGVDTYEVGILKGEKLCYDTGITDDVLGRLSPDEVTEVMIKVQQLQITQ